MYRIGDFLIQVKNAYRANKKQMVYPRSKIVESLCKILEKESYIGKTSAKEHSIEIELKYDGRIPALTDVKLISKPSVHRYVDGSKLKKVSRYGISIVSTSSGVMTGKDAVKKGVGGELICQIT